MDSGELTLTKLSSLIKKIRGVGVKSRSVPRIFVRPKNRYRKTVSFSDGEKRLGGAILEVASTEEERRRGLMGRKELPGICGMLFEGLEGGGSFWMKDCHVDLDALFMDRDGKITRIHSMPADGGGKRYGYDEGDASAIELPMGFCREHGITPGCVAKVRDIDIGG